MAKISLVLLNDVIQHIFLDEKLLQGQNLSVLLHQVFHGIKF